MWQLCPPEPALSPVEGAPIIDKAIPFRFVPNREQAARDRHPAGVVYARFLREGDGHSRIKQTGNHSVPFPLSYSVTRPRSTRRSWIDHSSIMRPSQSVMSYRPSPRPQGMVQGLQDITQHGMGQEGASPECSGVPVPQGHGWSKWEDQWITHGH